MPADRKGSAEGDAGVGQGRLREELAVAEVVLVDAPRVAAALLREQGLGALDVAGLQVDEGQQRLVRRRTSRRDRAIAVLVQISQQPAHVLADEVALQGPRRVRVAERESQV